MSGAARLRHVGVALSLRGTGGRPSIQVGPREGDGRLVVRAFVVATSKDDVRRLVRALEAFAVDLPDVSP